MLRDVFVKYKDEDDSITEGWFKLVELNSGYITFLTSDNEITIPLSRVIKIKRRGETLE